MAEADLFISMRDHYPTYSNTHDREDIEIRNMTKKWNSITFYWRYSPCKQLKFTIGN